MRTTRLSLAVWICCLCAALGAVGAPSPEEAWSIRSRLAFTGLCDASAAVTVTNDLLLVATDEDNLLRLYRAHAPGTPLRTYDLTRFLQLDKKGPEADLEAATRVGDRAFWIGSHGLNRDGKPRPNRCRFFATDLEVSGNSVSVTPVGQPCKTLLDQMLKEPRLAGLGLRDATAIKPKDEGGLNIEGLAATPEGTLLIGFRNPIPGGKALLVPLQNPNELINGNSAKFGDPILIDLQGLGVRDLLRSSSGFLVLAGPFGGGVPHRLGRWSGSGAEVEFINVSFSGYNPEAVTWLGTGEQREILVLSDDGSMPVGKKECKQLRNPAQRGFRALLIQK